MFKEFNKVFLSVFHTCQKLWNLITEICKATLLQNHKLILRPKLLPVKQGILFMLITGACYSLCAQPKLESGSHAGITGKVIDSASGEPLNYTTVTLLAAGGKKPVNGSTTDANGRFAINDVPDGDYKVVVDYVGYQPFTFNNVMVSNQNTPVDLKTISLVKEAALLQAVTISIQPKLVENKIDKVVFNAERDLTSQSGVATDVLKKVPQVSVDVDGNVELAGSSGVRFLINGKPSSAFGSNITDVLQSIPASQIKSIEVITNPGAKDDAEGLGGIINIILKKNNAHGVNGNISLTAGTRLENGSFNFSARQGKFGMNAWLSGNTRVPGNTISSSDRTTTDATSNTTTLLYQEGNNRFTRGGYQSGVGFDYDLNDHNTLSGSLSYNHFSNSSTGTTNQEQTIFDAAGNNISDAKTFINGNSAFQFHNVDASLDYKKTFKNEDQTLEIAANSSLGYNRSDNNTYQDSIPGSYLFYSTLGYNPAIQNETEIRADYVQPIKKNIKLGAGGKVSLYDIASNSNVSLLDPGTGDYSKDNFLSNNLTYHQKVYAGYAELSFPVGKLFNAKLGGRYERTDINSYFSNVQQQALVPGYNTFVPSIFFSRNLTENSLIRLSYSKRIQRPGYGDLNPFVNTSDPKNLSTGNPYLKPEIGQRIELGYSNDIPRFGSMFVSLFYRENNRDIQPFITYYPYFLVGDTTYSNVDVTTRQNIGQEKNIGLNVFADVKVASKFSIRTNLFFFYRHTINDIDSGYNYSSFNYHLNLNASYQFSSTLAAESFGNFQSPWQSAQGKYPSFATYSFAIRKQIWKKKGSIALNATNPFGEYVNQHTQLFGPGFNIDGYRRIPFRSIGINFTWKFGNLEFKKQKEDKEANLNPPSED
jgi:ferric enterobactin receptor